MEFKKTVMFLGIKRRVGDKGVTFVVDFFARAVNPGSSLSRSPRRIMI